MNIDQMKKQYEAALDEFIPLRNKEVDDFLTENEKHRYVELVDNALLPLSQKLHEMGEKEYLITNSFSYEM